VRLACWLLLVSTSASAERVVVQRGETLVHVAAAHGCTTEVVERANHVDTSLVKAGTIVEVPNCGRITSRARSRERVPEDDDAKAKHALAVIDGATWVPAWAPVVNPAEAVGAPWAGQLANASKLETGEGYVVKRPARSFGTKHLLEHLRGAIGEVRALYPNVPTLAIGDISAEYGGKISDHRSHQSGLDVDVGFYFTSGAVTTFADAGSAFDLEANWALLAAFTRIAALDDGVQMIFLDYDIQHRLYDFAKRRGTPDHELDYIFQYPRGRDELSGLVRHWPGHGNHFHVRFKP
jgi:murein endopeptidase